MFKISVLKRLKRTTRGKGKRDRMEWALVSKSNPKKILKWFGPEKPTKKEIAKEERRIHAFGAANIKNIINSEENMNIQILKELISLSNHLDSKGLSKEADVLDQIIKSAKKKERKPSEKQLKSLDKNHNGKIDKEDFEILRRKKENKADDSEAMKKCANCGHMNHHDAEKCSKCGHTKFEK